VIAVLVGSYNIVHDNLVRPWTLKFFLQQIFGEKGQAGSFGIFSNLKSVLFNTYENIFWNYGFWNKTSIETEHGYLGVVKLLTIMIITGLIIFLITAILLRKKAPFQRRRYSFILCMLLFMFILTPFTPTNLPKHHLLFLLPFICIVSALGLEGVSDSGKKGLVVAALLTAVIFSNNVLRLKTFYNEIAVSGGEDEFSSPAFRNMVGWLIEQRKALKAGVFPVSKSHNLTALVRLYTGTLFYPGWTYPQVHWVSDITEKDLNSQDIFVASKIGFDELMPKVRQYGYDAEIKKYFYDGYGKPAFICFRIIKKS
jgi:hypothetical protein